METPSRCEIARPLLDASTDFRFAASVDSFGMLLRDSPYRSNIKLNGIAKIASSSLGVDANGNRTEFVDLP